MNIQVSGSSKIKTSSEEIDGSIETLSISCSDGTDSVPVIEELSGNIEDYCQDLLWGWAIDVNRPTVPLKLQVFEKNKLIGESTADLYREDLKSLGFGNGCHGFKIELAGIVLDGETHVVEVVDSNSSLLLGKYEFVSEAFANATISDVEGGAVSGKLVLKETGKVGGFDMELLADGEVVGTGTCRMNEKSEYEFRIPLPTVMYDDSYHIYSVRLKGLPTKSNSIYERLNSIITPWEHLNNDITSNTVSTLSKISGYRYTAIQAHLRRKDANSACMENVISAHDVLVEGYEKRKEFPKLSLPKVQKPDISIVIPSYDAFSLTYNCIAAIILSSVSENYEVIVVDDCPEDQSDSLADYIDNLSVIKNEVNQGFLKSVNLAADSAKGHYIVLLNNDTEVTYGWADKLSYVFDTFNNVGMAGSKLIYPDGKLQEAGGIIWNNGKPWNVGNRQNADDPQYSYSRQADYLSGAAVMIKASVWNEVGQFSREYIPAYYEDTDLAFKVREAGYKTMYCAESVVVHFEGMSNGTDLNTGVKKHQLTNAPKFRARWRDAYRHNGVEGKNLQLEKDRNVDFRVLLIDSSTPKPDQDAGSYAVSQEVGLLQELGCKITFVPNNLAHMGAYTHELQRRGVECIYAPFYLNAVDFIKERGKEFDLVYVVRYDVAEDILDSVRKYSGAKVVLNNSDLHFLRELRAALAANEKSFDEPLRTRERELTVMKSVDAVLSYNDVEHSVIASHNMASDNVFRCPWVLTKKGEATSFDEREGIAFLGGYNHLPNREAVLYFVETVFPQLRDRLPGVKFNIYGSKVTEEIESLEADDVIIKGYVKSLSEVFDTCRVFVAPLLSGAGIKGKVLESSSYGVPAVLSPIAAESTGLVHDVSTLIAKSDKDWVDNIERLYNDKELWEHMSKASSSLVNELYSFESGLVSMRKMMSYLELDPALESRRLFKGK